MIVVALLWLLAPIAVVLLVYWTGLRIHADRLTALRGLPDSRFAPLVVALVMMGVIWYLWGSLRQVPVVHDEASYLLQAETFARGRWTMPSPPIPAFFEQFHVFVTPTFASKYPPGHGILLVPGIWLGLPGLVPVLLSGLAAALLFMLVRRVTNGWVATLTLVLWLPISRNLVFRQSYFSENTSSVLWLLGWWALLEWHETGRERWLSLVAACVGWMAITRPLTAVAFAIPIAAVVLWRVSRKATWSSLLRPAVLGVAIVSLVPIWSAKTTGNWRETPYALYSKIYFPFDIAGFGRDTAAAARPLPPDMSHFPQAFGPVHAEHTVGRLPRILYDRWQVMFANSFHGLSLPLALFALLSIAVLPAVAWFALAGSVVLTLCYLVFAHPATWDLYYLEIMPLFPFLTACGIWAVWAALGKRGSAIQRLALRRTTPHAALAGLIFGTLMMVPAHADIVRLKRAQIHRRLSQASFAEAVAQLPEPHTIVFIRYAPLHNMNTSLIANHADLPNARTWFVYDRGPENAALLALAPGRVPYLFDEVAGTLQRIPAK